MVKVKNIIRRIPLLSENILAEAANQPLLFLDAARYRVDKMRAKYAAKAGLEEFEAEQGLTIRHRADEKGEKRTEKYIKSRVMRHARYTSLRDKVHEAEAREEFAKLILEVLHMRKDAIRIIAAAEHYEGVKASAEVERIEQHRRLTKEARRLQNQYRRNRD